MKTTCFATFTFVVLSLLAALPATAAQTLRHSVHHLFVQGHPLGEVIRRDEQLQNGHHKHVYELRMFLKRGSTSLQISSKVETRTDEQLHLLGFTLNKKEGDLTILSEGTVQEGVLRLKTTRGANTIAQDIPLPAKTYSSLSYDFYVWRNRDSLKEFEARIFHEDLGTFADQSSQIIKKPAGYRMTHQALSMETQEQYDAKGRLQSAHTLQMDLWALVPGQRPLGATEKPLDILEVSTWKAPVLPQNLERVTYEISNTNNQDYRPYLDEFQVLKKNEKGLVRVEVRKYVPTKMPLSDAEKERLLQATALEPFEHPTIQRLAKKLQVPNAPLKTVEKVSHFVYQHITNKSLDRGAASALKPLSQRRAIARNTVFWHRHLRAQGFPTRLVDGLVVHSGRLGYHEWLEAYIEELGFVPVDPTFDEVPAGPNRLKFAVGDSTPEGMVALGITASQLLTGQQIKDKEHQAANGDAKSRTALPQRPT